MGHPQPNHDVGRVMASLQPQNVFLHLDGEDILIHDEDVFVCSWHDTGGDALLLSIGSPSKQA